MVRHRLAGAACFGAALVVLAVAATSRATEFAVVTEASGNLLKWTAAYSTPIPICCVSWTHQPEDGTTFHPELVDVGIDGDDPCCAGSLMVHCGGDTLAYAGTWPGYDMSGFPDFVNTRLTVHLEVAMQVDRETLLTAQRFAAGNLLRRLHTVTVTLPDETEVALLPQENTPGQADMLLLPGAYHVAIDVDIQTHTGVFEPYGGWVTVFWVDNATPVQVTTWGSIKTLFQ